jgi:hypothetical protein
VGVMTSTISLQLQGQHVVSFSLGKCMVENTSWSDDTVKLTEFWNQTTKLCLSTNLKNGPSQIPPTKEEFSIPLLKSTLQKAVRRRKSKEALNLAYQLLCQDRTDFLRRMPVIMMEDSFLHPDFPLLIWIMIADSKGWNMTKLQIQKLMRLVWDVAEGKYRDHIPSLNEDFVNPILSNDKIENSDSHVACILLRSNYGGMKGDIEFLKAHAILWNKRFGSDCKKWNEFWKVNYPENSIIDLEIAEIISKQPVLCENSKLSVGIDHHVFPKLVDLCRNDLKRNLDRELIRQAVWYHSSGVSHKQLTTTRENQLDLVFPESELEKSYLDSLDTWNIIKQSWIHVCDSKYWLPIALENSKEIKKRKSLQSNEKLTKYFKFQ